MSRTGLALVLGALAWWPGVAGVLAGEDPKTPVPFIEASGDGEVQVTPDLAVLTLGVVSEAPTAQEAVAKNGREMTAVLQALAAAGFSGPDVTTQRLTLSPVYESRPTTSRPRIIGYQAGNQVQIRTTRPASVGQALDAAVKAGANVSGALAFSLADPGAVELRALRLAVEDARRRATTVADALGMRVTRVLEVRALETFPPPGIPEGRMLAMRDVGGTPVEPGQLTVRARVTLRVELQ
jgi:uncharacterized protein YggE